MKSIVKLAFLCFALLLLWNCSKEEPQNPTTLELESIEFTNIEGSSLTLYPGDRFRVKYSLDPEELEDIIELEWSSSKEDVAEVDEDGEITALDFGRTEITASYGDVEASFFVDVVESELTVTDFTIPERVELTVGEVVEVQVVGIEPSGAPLSAIDWEISNDSYAECYIEGNKLYVKGLAVGIVTLYGRSGEVTQSCEVEVFEHHEYVDLGLPSGLKWATCNVGADSPEEYGDYYAWGETSTKSEYTEENSLTYGESMSDIARNITYDVARKEWGSSWRLPTKEEFDELVDNCEWIWTTQNGVLGYKVTGTNGNSIFLPAAGVRIGPSLYDAGDYGRYWSSLPLSADSAYDLLFSYGSIHTGWGYRYDGQSVRPVSE